MTLYKIISLTAFLICLLIMAFHFIRLIRLGLPKEYSRRKGDVKSAITYSFTGAMSPTGKESAYLHLPTYTAGLLYHTGTFICFALYFLMLFDVSFSDTMRWILICVLTVSGLSGLGIFIKRISLKKMRYLSNSDDYVSNLLVSGFQIMTLAAFLDGEYAAYYFIFAGVLFLYLPLGKLKHSLYFFAARYHLGFFYGWRGIWPLKTHGQVK
mgnify:CR=1 FL=1